MDDNSPLFQDADEQERLYAPQQIPDNAEVIADETGGIVPTQPRDTVDDNDVPVPVLGGTNVAATPMSTNFEPGEQREERDAEDGDSVFGRDPRDEPA